MRLDEALRKQQVRLHCDPVDDALASGRKRADLDHSGVVRRDVHHDVLSIHNLLPVFVDQFLACGGTMKAVATRILMAASGCAARIRRSRIGVMILEGIGRVWSELMMTMFFLPRARSSSL